MKNFIIIFFILLIGYKKPNSKVIITTTQTYGLYGKVELVSEKTINANFNENWNITVDTINPYCFIENRFFDKKGVITFIDYYSKDSLFITKSIYDSSNKNESQISSQTDKFGKIIEYTKFISINDSLVHSETFDSYTNDTISKTSTKIVNGKIIWSKTENIKGGKSSEWYYKRDTNGLEIEMKTIFSYDKDKYYQKIKIKYIEFDKKGNWTKRIQYNEKEKYCTLQTRLFKYYD